MVPLGIAAAISVLLALFAWRRRPAPDATAFVLLMLAVAEWSLAYALRLAGTDLATKLFWAKVRYLGIVIVPAAWLIFALQYTGRGKWLTRRNLTLLAIEPLCMLLLVWTNDWHGLYWSSVRLDEVGSFTAFGSTHGVAFWVHKVFRKFFRSKDRESRQATGTGLGLSIAKNLVEMQDGRIWLESEFRKGTTFHFTVPVAEITQNLSGEPALASVPGSHPLKGTTLPDGSEHN
ncbi:MAG: ATP-binding protein [Anaerolineae bacterium]|nr:ATP-binding protein [Anaerolineae bacterium]